MNRLLKIVDTCTQALTVVVFAIIMLVGLAQIISHYVFSLPIVWADELEKYLFIWLVMFGAAYGVRKKQLVAADVITSNLNSAWQKRMNVLVDLLSLMLCVAFVCLTPKMMILNNETISPTLGIPMS